MSPKRGAIALMGSGELTSTMVEVHKELLNNLGRAPNAVFLDTPAGFQLNADDIAQRAIGYFRDRVGHSMQIASFKSKTTIGVYETEKAYSILRNADYTLIGPGSPTYAVSQWLETPIPDILAQRINEGACLVAASAAALTVGCFTLPVYEIYKVGQDPHWAQGLRLLDHFGFSLAVVPHWNNAEGGTHDTRFCYMGEPRLLTLESLLPADVGILGLDEHTACLMDLETGKARVRGIGRVTLRRGGREVFFQSGESFPLDALRGEVSNAGWGAPETVAAVAGSTVDEEENSFWKRIEAAEESFERGMESGRPEILVSSLLELDRLIWKGQQDLEDPEFIAQARERFREMVVRFGLTLEKAPSDRKSCLTPLVEPLLRLRDSYRREKRWDDADLLRQCLHEAGLDVEDAPEGARWKLSAGDF